MSEIMIEANSGCMELVHMHSSSNLNKKKWHNTFLTIYCSRAFLSQLKGPHAAALNSDPHNGITGDEQAFSTNTYPSPPFLHFTLTPFKDPAILLLLACAAISLAIGIKEPRFKQGLYDGSTIFFLVFLTISISAVTSFTQSRRLPKLSTNVTDQATSRLNKLTSSMLKLGLAADFLVLVVWVIRYFTGYKQDDNGEKEFNWSRTKVVDVINSAIGIIAAVIIAVVATPERSPLALTLSFAYFMKRMMADQSMVRKLSACETMGSATTICTGKTGILAMNNLNVSKFWLGKESSEGGHNMEKCVMELLCEGIGLNTTGGVYDSGQRQDYSDNPTERAILSWAVKELRMDMEQVKSGCEILHVEPFNSEKKRSGVLMKRDHEFHVHWKGAAEMILAMCSHYYDLEGEKKDLNDEDRLQFNHIIQGMAASSLRCIAFAHKQSDEVNLVTEKKIEEDGMILLGLVGIKDPCRPCVKKDKDHLYLIVSLSKFVENKDHFSCFMLRN